MTEPIEISGNSAAEIEQGLFDYFGNGESLLQQVISLQQGGQTILLEIDIDPGGGFESGYATTRFSAPVVQYDDFAFTIHPEGFLADVGKLFGLQDEIIGYPEFDKKVIIKTNNKERVHALFGNESTRQILSELPNFNLQLKNGNEEKTGNILVLEIEEGITDGRALGQLYRVFDGLLKALNHTV